ncbi:MAG: threonine/serine exporter family protein [Prevotellaceae bacterium]|jgi:uncharacterized membrane protein YjjP (DUF1212 family)|nr:threonine/serine exporter family protein [Prevotellaceae bacterium]
MKSKNELKEIADFIADYATCLLGSGVHTSRVIRNSDRIGKALGVTMKMTSFPKTIILSVYDTDSDNVQTEVVSIPPLPINFEYNSELSGLSWDAYDGLLTLDEIRRRYHAVRARRVMPPALIVLLVGLANAAFCRLFGGDWGAVGVVFAATAAGFSVRRYMQRLKVNHFIVFSVSALTSSMIASAALWFDGTAEIALATSVLYLIPGVPLINGVIDIMEGHSLTGVSRLIQAVLLIICIAVGMSLPLLLFKSSVL